MRVTGNITRKEQIYIGMIHILTSELIDVADIAISAIAAIYIEVLSIEALSI